VFFYVTLLNLVDFAKDRLDREKGATAVEYGLMVALIAVGIIAAVTLMRNQLRTLFDTVRTSLVPAP
jgi:pilus assembly protein Flp/PilA